jgi:hypothetical protein
MRLSAAPAVTGLSASPPVPSRARRPAVAASAAASPSPAVALLYADFPGLGARWEQDEEATAALVCRAHARFAAAVAACGGEAVPAWVDACCARFPTAGASLAAAVAVRRAEREAGELAVRLAVASGPSWPGGTVPVPLHRRAWELAEAAEPDEVRLDQPAAEALAAQLPDGTRRGPAWRRALPGLGRWARAFVLRAPDRPAPA